jgi:hypothetical protein
MLTKKEQSETTALFLFFKKIKAAQRAAFC